MENFATWRRSRQSLNFMVTTSILSRSYTYFVKYQTRIYSVFLFFKTCKPEYLHIISCYSCFANEMHRLQGLSGSESNLELYLHSIFRLLCFPNPHSLFSKLHGFEIRCKCLYSYAYVKKKIAKSNK